MKKLLKNVLKWALLVWISFALIFTTILSMEQMEIMEAIKYKVYSIDEPAIYKIESSKLQEYSKHYQQMADESLGNDYVVLEDMSDEYKNRELELKELYKKYPVGVFMFFIEFSNMESISNLYIISLIMGIVVGTGIYLLLDKNKKGLKVIIILYILFVLILGFIQGIGRVAGENLTLLDRWIFPDEYFLPVTVIFALVVIGRFARQKEFAKKLNEKLKEIKEENKQ